MYNGGVPGAGADGASRSLSAVPLLQGVSVGTAYGLDKDERTNGGRGRNRLCNDQTILLIVRVRPGRDADNYIPVRVQRNGSRHDKPGAKFANVSASHCLYPF